MKNIFIKAYFLFVAIKRGYNKFFAVIQFYFFSVSIAEEWKINGQLFIRNRGLIRIGKRFLANSSKNENPIGGDLITRFIVGDSAILEIGDNVGISNSTIVCKENIQIGDNVLIGGGCRIWDSDFHSLDALKRGTAEDIPKNSPIKIENNVFVGAGTIVLKGVTIGEGAIIGAGSVVSRNIPSNEIWAGNPIVFIKKQILN